MSFITDHLERIVDANPGELPLPVFLRSYFRQYPKLGSRDRRALSEAAFIYYRCKSFYREEHSAVKVVTNGYRLCNSHNVFLAKMLGIDLQDSDVKVDKPALQTTIRAALSDGISTEDWLRSMWQQPQLFIRVRKDKALVMSLLEEHNITFTDVAIPGNEKQDCLMLPNGAAIDQVLPEDSYVVQDWASQASMYQLAGQCKSPVHSIWDVCSGAGGKSILLKDTWPPFQLLATDIRDTILHNLKARFRLYGLGKVKTHIVDSADADAVREQIGDRTFDLVLCDVPCSGSGTWARSPEQFYFFKDRDLEKFEALQYAIALNASRYIAAGGLMAYVTCSVFKQENEAVMERLVAHAGLELVHQQIINGIAQKGDCMFLSVFRKAVSES